MTANVDYAASARWLREQAAEILVVQELDEDWMDALEEALVDHTRVPTDTARDDNFGIGVWVVKDTSWRDLKVHSSPASKPWIEVVVTCATREVRVMAVHTIPPIGGDNTARRDTHIREALERAAKSPEPVLIAGDLNATIWSKGLREALFQSGFRPACLASGLRGSWHSRIAGISGGILIDHVLAGR